MSRLLEKTILQGSKLYTTSINAVLFGCPTEILKFLLFQKQALPSINTLIPAASLWDLSLFFQYSQVKSQFLIYHFLFVN